MTAITDHQQSVYIPADSAIDVTTGGSWSGTNISGDPISASQICDDTGTPLAQGAHTAFVSIYRKSDGVELVTQQQLNVWLTSGAYKGTIAATICTSGSGPWRRVVEVFGPSGTSDTKFGTWRADWVESDGPR